MAKHQCIPLDSPSEWKAALQGIKHGPADTWEYSYAMHLTTNCKTYLYCFEKGNVRVICPIVEREFNGYVDIVKPFGYTGFVGTGDCPEFPYYWKEFAKQQGYICGYLGVNPLFENDSYFEQSEVHQYNSIYVVDLTLSYDELFANLSRDVRRRLKNWDNILASIVLEKTVLEDFFLSNYRDFLRRKNASSFYMLSEETVSFLANTDYVDLVGAQTLGKIEAVGLITHTPDVGEGFLYVSLPEGRHHSTALNWYFITHLKSIGVPLANLGGGSSDSDGIAQFKQQFGSKRVPLKCLKQVYEPGIYERLCRQVGADPNDIAGYFPAYRAPR
jgi:hypothetical protein